MSQREGDAAEKSLTMSTRLQVCHMHHVPNIDCLVCQSTTRQVLHLLVVRHPTVLGLI